jgi:hypothetical protein
MPGWELWRLAGRFARRGRQWPASEIGSPAQGATATHPTNCRTVWYVNTLATGTSQHVLRFDGVSKWIYLYMVSNGDVRVYKKLTILPTLLIQAGAGSLSGGDRLELVMDGSNFEISINGTSAGTSAAGDLEGETNYFYQAAAGETLHRIEFYNL